CWPASSYRRRSVSACGWAASVHHQVAARQNRPGDLTFGRIGYQADDRIVGERRGRGSAALRPELRAIEPGIRHTRIIIRVWSNIDDTALLHDRNDRLAIAVLAPGAALVYRF